MVDIDLVMMDREFDSGPVKDTCEEYSGHYLNPTRIIERSDKADTIVWMYRNGKRFHVTEEESDNSTSTCKQILSIIQIAVTGMSDPTLSVDTPLLTGPPLSRCLPQPQLTIYLEAEFDTLKPRLDAKDRSVDEWYYESVISVYTSCINDDWLRLSAELPVDVLHDRVLEEVTHRFELGYSPAL